MLRIFAIVNLLYQIMMMVVMVTGYSSMGEVRQTAIAKIAYMSVIVSAALAIILSLGVLAW